MLLSPLNPDQELSVYQCNEWKRKYYFCPKCGVRCLTFGGEGETDVVDVTDPNTGRASKRETWRAKWDGNENTRPYVAVNGTTIDFREDLDLRVLTEEKRVQYFNGRSDPKEELEARWERPHCGGCY